MRLMMTMLLSLSLILTACGGDSDDSEPENDVAVTDDDSTTNPGIDTTQTGEITMCSCNAAESGSYCQQFDDKPDDDRPMLCGVLELYCPQMGGTYSTTEPCPSENLMGSCYDDEADDEDASNTKTMYYYSTGPNPYTAATAQVACEEDEVFAPAP
jgi:hypothetical protein